MEGSSPRPVLTLLCPCAHCVKPCCFLLHPHKPPSTLAGVFKGKEQTFQDCSGMTNSPDFAGGTSLGRRVSGEEGPWGRLLGSQPSGTQEGFGAGKGVSK